MHEQDVKQLDASAKAGFFIVGIGASAGGLEALERFFASMPPNTGLSFVVVQHLSPDFESLMDELLARRTKIPIHRVEDGMRVAPDAIYLIPPKKDMIISEGTLLLTDKDPSKGLALPIDQFFRSLSQDVGARSIGIIMSGTGSDGSRGIRDIHEAGGLVMAQSEETARFDGMPRSAIGTGVVDLVLDPEQMPDALLHHIDHPSRSDDGAMTALRWASEELGMNAIYGLLRKEYGIDFSHYKPSTVARRIERRLSLMNLLDLDEYVERLREDAGELNSLYRDLLIGVTSFFRDPSAFSILGRELAARQLAELRPGQELRYWVAGCATGEEAYSIAILLHEQFEAVKKRPAFKIFATDVHRKSLDFASAGIYRDESLKELSPRLRERYFHPQGDGFQVDHELRQTIVFAPHNVIKDAPFTKLDLVTCRNLLIYLQPLAQKKALSLFHFGLKAGGLMFLGPSESPAELEDEFETLDPHWKIYSKRRDVRLATDFRLPSATPSAVAARRFEPLPAPSRYGQESDSHLFGAYDALLDEFLPPSVLLNQNREVLHAFGGAEKYLRLKGGRPSSDVLELVDSDLRIALAGALRRAIKENSRVDLAGMVVAGTNGPMRMTVGVRPVPNRASRSLCLLVTFEELDGPAPVMADIQSMDTTDLSLSREQVLALESELRYTKENLQATVEELETSNEELQATNEELVASNEELQSTNEELHSANEELYTVNAEYQRKITELVELTDDIDNLLSSTEVGAIFLDRNLRIRKFTPRIATAFDLLPQDIGRRIDTFSNNIDDSQLLAEVTQVLQTEVAIEREVRDRSGNWFFLRILPYRTRSTVDGVVLTLIDISALKRTESELEAKDRELQGVLDNSTAMIFIKDLDGRYRLANRHCEATFGLDGVPVVGRTDADLLPSPVAAALRANDQRVLQQGEAMEFEETVPGPQGPRTLLAIKFPLRNREGEISMIGGVCSDITRQKQAEETQRQAVDRRDQFLAMLSHELRNPLGAILNATYLLEQDVGGATEDEARNVIGRQSRHMARLLDDLLDVSRITQNKIAIRRRVIDLRETVQDALQTVRPLIDARAQDVKVTMPDEPLFVDGDPSRLQQIQVNLLTNASKYTPPGEQIWLTLIRHESGAQIQVRDSGVGIPPQMLEAVFDLFVQADELQGQSHGGMGVGLTLVRSLVELHDGTVVVKSDGLGQGSEFIVTLPLATQPKTVSRPVSNDASQMDASVLIIEDNEDSREMLSALLKLNGLHVRTAADGLEGLAAIASDPPDIALVDIGLPGLDGYEVARRVRGQLDNAGTLLVALTGFGQGSDRQAALEAGFDDHLVKPLQFDRLRQIVTKHLSRT